MLLNLNSKFIQFLPCYFMVKSNSAAKNSISKPLTNTFFITSTIPKTTTKASSCSTENPDMKDVTIDCRGFVPRSDLHKAFADALSFPDHYGNNLDALHDCLTAISENTHITFLHFPFLPFSSAGLLRVLRDSENENPNLEISFVTS